MKVDWQPKQIAVVLFASFALLAAITTSLGVRAPLLVLNENQILYLFSTSAQVLAGIYGLTLTSFVFLRNELSREESEDATLTEAIQVLKSRYFGLLIVITTFVILTLLLLNLVISTELQEKGPLGLAIMNSAQSAYVASLLAIFYFIVDVVAPGRVAKASSLLHDRADPGGRTARHGDLSEFLRNYNQIEALLTEADMPQQVALVANHVGMRRRMSNNRLAQMLYRNERISRDLYERLVNLITLRNSIIHGADPVVSEAAVTASRQVLDELRTSLQVARL